MKYQELFDISEDWLKYAIKLNLLHESKNDFIELRQLALKDKKIISYLNNITDFHSSLVTNHKNPNLPIHNLLFLLDLGFDTSIYEIQMAIDEILKHKDEFGVYQSLTKIPKHFGGTGEEMYSWCLCDAPLLLLALIKAGVNYEKHVKSGVEYLISLQQSNQFPCTVSSELGKFRGPGRKGDCCPYATLLMIRLLSVIPEYKESELINGLCITLLTLWENSQEKHPYMFYMGNDFRKLKAPTHWYDIVSVTYTLSNISSIKDDSRFQEMIDLIKCKSNKQGMYVPEAVYQKSKEWDFGQKKNISPYLTYICFKIFQNLE